VIGIILYLRATHTRRFAGHFVLWTFIVVFTALWLLSFNGAPPPSVHVLVTVDLILFPIVFVWAYWIDRFATAERDRRASGFAYLAANAARQKVTCSFSWSLFANIA
jgi:hypothetical protein